MKRTLTILVLLFVFANLGRCLTLQRAPTGGEKEEGVSQEESPEPPVESGDESGEETPSAEGKVPVDGSNVLKDTSPDRKGRPIRTYFFGNELIREKVVVNGVEVTRITLRGGATIQHEKVTLSAPEIIIEEGSIGRLRGGVRITDRESGMIILSQNADYDRGAQRVTLHGFPRLRVQKKGEKPSVTTCNLMERDLAAKISYLKGDVRIYHEGMVLLADQGSYHDENDNFYLETNPVVLDHDLYLTGKKMIYNMPSRRATLDGDVAFFSRSEAGASPLGETVGAKSDRPVSLEEYARRGGRIASGSEKQGGSPQKEGKESMTMVLTGDRLTYEETGERSEINSGEKGAGAKGAKIEVTGNVAMTREDMELRAPHLISSGEDFNLLLADQGVKLLDKKQRIRVMAGLMKYDREKGTIRLEKEPRMEFLQKSSDEVKGTLEGAIIESDLKKDFTRARGNVAVTGQEFKATGEQASYHREEGVIVMEGDPGLEKGNSVIHSEKILIYPDKNRVLLQNRISGGFK